MSITTTYDYNSGSNFFYNTSLIGFSGGAAVLLISPDLGLTESPTISASTYNSSLLTYTSGALKQLDQRPSNATYYASWSSQLNANWSGTGNGSLVVTPINGAAISAGVLNLTGSTDKYVAFSPLNNTDSAQTGTIEFQITPNYTGTPSAEQDFFIISQSTSLQNSGIYIYHFTDGNVYLQINDNAGTSVINLTSAWAPVSGTTYTFTLNYNGSGGAGATQLYINGVSIISSALSFTRTGITLSNGVIGKYYNLASPSNANFSISNISAYSSVLTPSSPVLNATIYALATAVMPLFNYSGIGSLVGYTSFSVTDSNSPAYTLNGLYFNGTAWVASDSTYAQANLANLISANIASLPTSNTLQIDTIYNSGSVQGSCSAITVTYTGQSYPTNDPTISPNMTTTIDHLYNFTSVQSSTGSDGVRFFLQISGINYYYNGSAWVVSNESFAESNSASVIQANASTLPVSLGSYITPYAVLHSASGTTTPSLTSLSLSYDLIGPPPVVPNICTVYGYIVDQTGTVVPGALVTVTNISTFLNQSVIEAQSSRTVITDSLGYFTIDLNETTTAGIKLLWKVIYPNTGVQNLTYTFGYALIPNINDFNFASFIFTPTP